MQQRLLEDRLALRVRNKYFTRSNAKQHADVALRQRVDIKKQLRENLLKERFSSLQYNSFGSYTKACLFFFFFCAQYQCSQISYIELQMNLDPIQPTLYPNFQNFAYGFDEWRVCSCFQKSIALTGIIWQPSSKSRLIEAQTKVKHLNFIKVALKVLSASLWLKIISADV